MGDEPNKEAEYREPGELSNDKSARDYPETPSSAERPIRQGRGDQGIRRIEWILARRPRGGGGGGGGGGSKKQDKPYPKVPVGSLQRRISRRKMP